MSDTKLGKVKGKIVFTYEDSDGKTYKEAEAITTEIEADWRKEQCYKTLIIIN